MTGFKFIGEQSGFLEKKGEADRFILGFEESYGYLTGEYVRDKDGVNASLMICEMCAYYKTRGLSLIEVLNQIYHKYGYCLNTQHCYDFEGSEGSAKMQRIMENVRNNMPMTFAGKRVVKIYDYQLSVEYDYEMNLKKEMCIRDSDYTLGEVIQMEQEQKRCESGWGEIENGGRWTQAGEATMYFDKLPDKNLKLELVCSKPVGNTEILIRANGQTIWQEVKNTAVKEEQIQMVIDQGMVLDLSLIHI